MLSRNIAYLAVALILGVACLENERGSRTQPRDKACVFASDSFSLEERIVGILVEWNSSMHPARSSFITEIRTKIPMYFSRLGTRFLCLINRRTNRIKDAPIATRPINDGTRRDSQDFQRERASVSQVHACTCTCTSDLLRVWCLVFRADRHLPDHERESSGRWLNVHTRPKEWK